MACSNGYANTTRISIYGLIVWGLATVFYSFNNLLNVSPGAMKPELSLAFNLSASELGVLSSYYLWACGLMQIPAGILMDKIGPRKMLTVASAFCALGCLAFSIADTIFLAKVGRLLIGLGASFTVVGCSKIASVWFHPRQFAMFTGLMVSVGMLGAAFGLAFVNKIINTFGWRESIMYGAYLAFGMCVLIWLLIRDYPKSVSKQEQSVVTRVNLKAALTEVMGCSQAWYAAIYAGLMFVPTLAFGALWGTPYLVEAHGYSQQNAGLLASMVFVGWIVGGPLYGFISDKMGKRNPPMRFANITTLAVCIALIYLNNLSAFAIGMLMFLLGALSSGFVIAFAVTRESNPDEISGTAIGFINMLNTFSVAIFQWLIGAVLDFVASDNIVSGADGHFTLTDYQTALTSLPICLIVSYLVLLKVKETNCESK